MDKKFVSGTVFGLVIGTIISIATPMFGAKDIVIKQPGKSTTSTQSKSTVNAASGEQAQAGGGMSAEAVQILKEMNNRLKENSDQNQEIIQQLSNLNKKQGI